MSDIKERSEAMAKENGDNKVAESANKCTSIKAAKHAAPDATADKGVPAEQDKEDDEEDVGWIGPMPTEAVSVKKRKGIYYLDVLLFFFQSINVSSFHVSARL